MLTNGPNCGAPLTDKCLMQDDSRYTIDQIALIAKVSRTVVSRVLNNRPGVSAETRQHVLEIIEKYHYRPSSVARSLATERSFEICILTPRAHRESVGSGYWPLLHLGITEALIQRGYFATNMVITQQTAAELTGRVLRERSFSGYILITQEVTTLLAPALRDRKAPVVLIGADPEKPDLSSVDAENETGAYEATQHLMSLGHRRIGLILGGAHLLESAARRAGFETAFREANLPVDPLLVVSGAYTERSGYDVMNDWLRGDRAPTAVFCASDTIAAGVCLALFRARYRVPDDISVVGFGDLPGSAFTTPPLTTVGQPIYEKGERAANMIVDLIEGNQVEPLHVVLPSQLIIRESSGPRRVGPSTGAA